MPTISIRKTYLTFLEAFGSPSILVEDAVRKYVIDKTVERIERSREAIEQFERNYKCDYAHFIGKLSTEDGLKEHEALNPTWEADQLEWEYWIKELEEWKLRLEAILMTS